MLMRFFLCWSGFFFVILEVERILFIILFVRVVVWVGVFVFVVGIMCSMYCVSWV